MTDSAFYRFHGETELFCLIRHLEALASDAATEAALLPALLELGQAGDLETLFSGEEACQVFPLDFAQWTGNDQIHHAEAFARAFRPVIQHQLGFTEYEDESDDEGEAGDDEGPALIACALHAAANELNLPVEVARARELGRYPNSSLAAEIAHWEAQLTEDPRELRRALEHLTLTSLSPLHHPEGTVQIPRANLLADGSVRAACCDIGRRLLEGDAAAGYLLALPCRIEDAGPPELDDFKAPNGLLLEVGIGPRTQMLIAVIGQTAEGWPEVTGHWYPSDEMTPIFNLLHPMHATPIAARLRAFGAPTPERPAARVHFRGPGEYERLAKQLVRELREPLPKLSAALVRNAFAQGCGYNNATALTRENDLHGQPQFSALAPAVREALSLSVTGALFAAIDAKYGAMDEALVDQCTEILARHFSATALGD